MFICLDCGKKFRNLTTYYEPGNGGYYPGGFSKGCPECAGACQEAFTCSSCGEALLQEELTAELCLKCGQELKQAFWQKLNENFAQSEIAYFKQSGLIQASFPC